MLVYIAVVLTVIAVVILLGVVAVAVLTRPRLAVTGGDETAYPNIVVDPEDAGVRVVHVEVVSALPLTWVDARYRVELPDSALRLDGASHREVVDALRAAQLDDATWDVTYMSPGAALPRAPWPVFVLTLPLTRRLAVLEATVTLRDPLGRTLLKTVPALPKQPLARPVRAAEHGSAGAST